MTPSHQKNSLRHRQPKVLDSFDRLWRFDNPSVISSTIPILLVAATLGADKYQAVLPVPASSLALGALVFCAAFFRPVQELTRPLWFAFLTLSIPIWMLISTIANGVNGSKRLANITMEALLILVISSGRICVISIARGAVLALFVGTFWGFVTFDRSTYPGRLVGGLGDPNNAGMVLLLLALIGLAYTRNLTIRVLVGLVALAGVAGTFSRTSLFALVVAAAWVAVGDRLPIWVRFVTVGGLIWYVTSLPKTEYTSGVFAGREGSDALRSRIDEAAQLTVQQHPIIGNGAGSAQTTVQGETFFFHSSYQSLRAEGGWILLIIVLLLIGLTLISLLRLRVEYRNKWIEASLVASMVCAVNLGEVFLAPPVMLALGVAIRHIAVSRRRERGVGDLPRRFQSSADHHGTSSDVSEASP